MKKTTKSPAPAGVSTVCAFLIVDSIEKELDFLSKVFDAEIVDSYKQPDGVFMHASVRIGDSTIMMGKSMEKYPATQSMHYIYVDNADTVYENALEYGATSVMEPADQFYGNREGGFKDPQGNTWWVAQFKETVSKEDIERHFAETISKPTNI